MAFLAYVVIILFPLFSMIRSSFTVDEDISFKNYVQALWDARQFKLFCNSLALALGATTLAVLIGVPLGFLLHQTDIYFRNLFQFIYLVPLIIPPYLSAIAWIDLLGRRGSINIFLMGAFSLAQPPLPIYGLFGCIIILALSLFPFVTLLTMSGLSSMDHRLEEAAALAHHPLSVVRYVTLPLITPHIVSGGLFVFIFAISNYGVPDLLRVKVYPVEIFLRFSAYHQEGMATALSMPLMIVSLAAIGLIRHCMKNRTYVTLSTNVRRSPALELGMWGAPSLCFVLLIIILSVILPVGVLLIRSGSITSYITALNTACGDIMTSIVVGLMAATTMLMWSFPLAYCVERSRPLRRTVVDVLSLLPFAVPATVLGIGMIQVWNNPATSRIYGSPLILIFGYGARFLPFVIRAIGSNLRQIHAHLEEAAHISGRTWTQIVSRIVVPLCRPGVVAGWCLAYVFSMGELETTLLVTPPGTGTLPLRIYTLMHYGAHKLVAALCIILIMVTLAPIGSLFLLKGAFTATRSRTLNTEKRIAFPLLESLGLKIAHDRTQKGYEKIRRDRSG